MRMLLHNGELVDRGGRWRGYLVIEDDFIAMVGEGEAPSDIHADQTVDLKGAMLMPGAIDTHVHFREPGLTQKATIASESAAAVAGGVTSFLEMPNTVPAAVTQGLVEEKMEIAAKSSLANYAFFIGATNSNVDEILRADYSCIPGVKLFMGSSTGNMLVDSDQSISRLFKCFKGVIAVHAEDEATIRDAKEKILARYGEDAPVSLHHELRSADACFRATERAVALARRYGARLHLLHISTARELSLLEAGPVEGKRITAETCPHYLLFDCTMLSGDEGHFKKCNPAIKTASDRDALLNGVVDGLIDTIATDHAPHRREDKEGSLFKAASGMPGVKFMLPLMMDLASKTETGFTPELVVEKCCNNPARLYGIERRGFLEPGYFADLTVVERVEPRQLTHADALSHLAEGMAAGPDWTPYAGVETCHRVALTIVNGQIVYDGNSVLPTMASRPLRFRRL